MKPIFYHKKSTNSGLTFFCITYRCKINTLLLALDKIQYNLVRIKTFFLWGRQKYLMNKIIDSVIMWKYSLNKLYKTKIIWKQFIREE